MSSEQIVKSTEMSGDLNHDNRKRIVVFALDGPRYTLSSVERVVRAVEITHLPNAPAIVQGAINVQGVARNGGVLYGGFVVRNEH